MLAAVGTVTVSGAEPYCETPPAIAVIDVTYAPSGVLDAVAIVRVADPPAWTLPAESEIDAPGGPPDVLR
jgi:hypothetical protein